MSHPSARIYEQLSTLVRPIEPSTAQTLGCIDLLAALERFKECVRYLNTRRSKGAILNIQGEDDVQDALFLMLRLWVTDLTYENPTDRVANRFSIKDFLVPQARTIIEAKFVRDKSHTKSVVSELNDDIENYRHHPCTTASFSSSTTETRSFRTLNNYDGRSKRREPMLNGRSSAICSFNPN